MARRMTLLCVVGLFLFSGWVLADDTGTYRILEYAVRLTPASDGSVQISYYQKWLVTGGHIPWITVGLPNDNFQILTYNDQTAVKSIQSANYGDWSGVRLDLDKDYQSGETFTVAFAVEQQRLFYASEGYYGLKFTPGWYDRAEIEELLVEVLFFADIDSVKASPEPTKIDSQIISWKKQSLKPGEHFSVEVSFPKANFPEIQAVQNTQESGEENSGSGHLGLVMFIIFVVAVLVVFFIARFNPGDSVSGGGYSGGHIFYGGGSAGDADSGSRSSGGGSGGDSSYRSPSGGGGFGGRASSCACACVSCACACACAGGGGAGCARKNKLRINCKNCRNLTCPFHQKGAGE